MKMKEFGPPGGGARPWRPPLDPPMDIAESCETNMDQSVKVIEVNCTLSLFETLVSLV